MHMHWYALHWDFNNIAWVKDAQKMTKTFKLIVDTEYGSSVMLNREEMSQRVKDVNNVISNGLRTREKILIMMRGMQIMK